MEFKLPPHNLEIDEKKFLELLKSTDKFSDTQKLKILKNISIMKQWQFDMLMEELEEEIQIKIKKEYNTLNISFSLTELKEYLNKKVISQEDAKNKLVLSFYEHVVFGEKEDYLKPNLLLLGPTGSGKTYMASLLANYINLPFVTANAAGMVSSGYVGTKLDEILTSLYLKAGRDLKKAQKGVILIDEFDKTIDEMSHNSVGGRELQQEFLKLIEGDSVLIKTEFSNNAPKIEFNTKNLLFIMAGAFSDIKEIVNKRNKKHNIGFNKKSNKGKFQVLHSDIVAYGILPELAGRIQNIAVLDKLSQRDLYNILKLEDNPYLTTLREFFKYHGSDIEFTDGALKAIAKEAFEMSLGARALKSVINEVSQNLKFELIKNSKKKYLIDKRFVGKLFK